MKTQIACIEARHLCARLALPVQRCLFTKDFFTLKFPALLCFESCFLLSQPEIYAHSQQINASASKRTRERDFGTGFYFAIFGSMRTETRQRSLEHSARRAVTRVRWCCLLRVESRTDPLIAWLSVPSVQLRQLLFADHKSVCTVCIFDDRMRLQLHATIGIIGKCQLLLSLAGDNLRSLAIASGVISFELAFLKLLQCDRRRNVQP